MREKTACFTGHREIPKKDMRKIRQNTLNAIIKAGEKYPLLKDTLNYTEFFSETMVFNDIVAVYEYIERHGLEKLATVIKA